MRNYYKPRKVHYANGKKSMCGTEYYAKNTDEYFLTEKLQDVTCGNCIRKIRMYRFHRKEGWANVFI